MREIATLQRRRYPEREAEQRLHKALAGRGGTITRADATALTGLSSSETDQALKALAGNYRSHLAVTEDGELLYTFDRSMTRRDKMPLSERAAAVGQALWKGFTVAFKVWIAVTLVVYVAAFVAMLIAMVFARASGDRDDRRGRDGGGGFPLMLYLLMPDWAPAHVQRQQLRGRTGPRKRFYKSVFDFVFGPPSTPADPLAAEKELVAFIRAQDGRITATDLVSLTGWSYHRADEEATRLLVDYDGEPEVADSGALIYVFPSLRRTAGGPVDGRWRYAWQEPHALAPLTGNRGSTDGLIAGLNGFNLVSGLTVGPAFLAKFGLAASAAALTAVTWFPLAFSSVFFTVPAGRWVQRRRNGRRLRRQALRAELVRQLVARRGVATTPSELTEAAAQRLDATPADALPVLERLLLELDGDVTTDDEGRVRYAFPRIADELEAAQRARSLAPASEREVGQVVFSSADDDAALPAARRPRLLDRS